MLPAQDWPEDKGVTVDGCATAAGWLRTTLSPRYGDKPLPAGCTAQARAKTPAVIQSVHFNLNCRTSPLQKSPQTLPGEGRSLPATGKGGMWSAHVFTHQTVVGCGFVHLQMSKSLIPASWQKSQSCCAQQLHTAGGMDHQTCEALLHHQPGFTQQRSLTDI